MAFTIEMKLNMNVINLYSYCKHA